MSDQPRKFEEFRVSQKLGEGTFSQVLKVKHKASGKFYAMKRFRKRFNSTFEEIQNLREIQALRRLNPHNHVIDLIEVIFDQKHGVLALNFELMDCNLYELFLRKNVVIGESKAKNYFFQICTGLEYMHSKGIFHRDIKPENILVKDNTIKLADFGSCRGIHSKQPYTEYIATRWYRSPECFLCYGVYNFKMDIWGAGCVLYEILSKAPLFPGSNGLDQLHRIHAVLGTPSAKLLQKMLGTRSGSPEYNFPLKEGTGIQVLLPQISEVCIDLINAMLMYDPDLRLTAKEVLKHGFFKNMQPSESHIGKSDIVHSARDSSATTLKAKLLEDVTNKSDGPANSYLKKLATKHDEKNTSIPVAAPNVDHVQAVNQHENHPPQHPSENLSDQAVNQTVALDVSKTNESVSSTVYTAASTQHPKQTYVSQPDTIHQQATNTVQHHNQLPETSIHHTQKPVVLGQPHNIHSHLPPTLHVKNHLLHHPLAPLDNLDTVSVVSNTSTNATNVTSMSNAQHPIKGHYVDTNRGGNEVVKTRRAKKMIAGGSNYAASTLEGQGSKHNSAGIVGLQRRTSGTWGHPSNNSNHIQARKAHQAKLPVIGGTQAIPFKDPLYQFKPKVDIRGVNLPMLSISSMSTDKRKDAPKPKDFSGLPFIGSDKTRMLDMRLGAGNTEGLTATILPTLNPRDDYH
ncbi:hypothetical protein RTP6_005711 [Batrachochytrium dendrobatidis]